MDASLTCGQNAALVVLAFLQADCKGSEYRREVLSLAQDIHLTPDINCNDQREEHLDEGNLETDGHLCSRVTLPLDGIGPSADLQRPGNHADGAALRQVAEHLREIAAQLEHSVVAQATQNLTRNITESPMDQWKEHLSQEVDRAMKLSVSLKDLSQEVVTVALTLTLVKGVCERAPQLLKSLFNTALQCISAVRPR